MLGMFFECVYFSREVFHKMKFISTGLAPRNPQGVSSTHYPKCVTAVAEEVTALGLCSGGWLVLRRTGLYREYCCCFVPGHSSIFGSDTTTKAVSVLISHMYIIPFPCNFQCPFGFC